MREEHRHGIAFPSERDDTGAEMNSRRFSTTALITLTATITRGAVEDLCLVPGASVSAAIKAGAVHLSCRDRSAEQESSRMLKKSASGVLSSFRPSTY